MGNVAKTAMPSPKDLPELIYGVPVREVLSAPILAGATVLAGASGLDRVVARVNVMEVPDILPWVKPDELLLTTGYPLREAARAHNDLEARKTTGSTVLLP